MNNYSVRTYQKSDKTQWDQFVRESKNGTFLFLRDFMEYHEDRFSDASLLVFKQDNLVAILPANQHDKVVHSHQGLSYGGILLKKRSKFEEIHQVYKSVLVYLENHGVSKLHLKLIPSFYTTHPSEELNYLLFLTESILHRVHLTTVIDYRSRMPIQGNRKEGVKKAERAGLTIKEEDVFELFWQKILIPNLELRHGAKPVHSTEEITRLAKAFPKNIHQFNVYHKEEIVAGCTIFETKTTAHVQYISANSDRQQLGSLDLLFQFLIDERFSDKGFFDFGTSNENQGLNVNGGLLYWKECFGARSKACYFYEVDPSKHTQLDTVII